MSVPEVILFDIDIIRFWIDFGIFYLLLLAVSLTLNLEAGYAGVPNFGKVLFVAGGAAAAGAVVGRLAVVLLGISLPGDYNIFIARIVSTLNEALSGNVLLAIALLLIGLLLAAGVGASLGYLVSFPSIRLREDYLGMLLLASAQFFQIFLRSYEPLIGGTQGLLVPDVFAWAKVEVEGAATGILQGLILVLISIELTSLLIEVLFYFGLISRLSKFKILTSLGLRLGVLIALALSSSLYLQARDLAVLGVFTAFTSLVFLYMERVARSPLGRTLRAMRDDEVAARSLGKDDVALRRNVIVIASAISGMAGALLTFYVSSVGAETWTRITWTFWPWVIVIMGGAANNLGVALGAFFFTFIIRGVDQVQFRFQGFIPFDVNWLEYLAVASLLVLILILRPGGVMPEKPSETLPRQSLYRVMEPRSDVGERLPERKREEGSEPRAPTSQESRPP